MSVRRRWFRALFVLTVSAVTGTVPNSADWMLDTALVLLKKSKVAVEASDNEDNMVESFLKSDAVSAGQVEEPLKYSDLRLFRMGELLRKVLSQRLLSGT